MRSASTSISPSPPPFEALAPPIDQPRGISLLGALEPLRIPRFRVLMIAVFCFTAAIQMEFVAQGWLVFHLTGSSLSLGVVTAMWGVSVVIFSPLGGVVADRIDRKRLMMLTWVGSGAVFAIITALIQAGQIQVWHLAAAALLNGVFFCFNIPARFVLISQLVGDARLMGAIALVSVTFSLSGASFPLISGRLIDLVGAVGAYGFIALLYFLASGVVSLLPPSRLPPREERSGVIRELVEGVRSVWRAPALRWLLFLALASVVLGQPLGVLLPRVAAQTLSVPASGLGLLFVTIALGALAGNLLVANLQGSNRLGGWMILLAALYGVSLVGLALARSLLPALGALFFLGLISGPFFTINQTLVQLYSAPEIRGRVMSLYMLTFAAMPLGTMPLAALADSQGASASLFVAGGALLSVIILVAWLRPALLNLSVARAASSEPIPAA